MPAIKVLQKSMTMPQIREKARELGIKPGKTKKTELIRIIQQAEGNNPCYGRSNGQCPNIDCCFMSDCLKIRS